MIETTAFSEFMALLTAILLAIIAWYNKQRTESATVTAEATTATARTNAAMAVQTTTGVRKMDDSTKRWCTFDATPENKQTILDQIAAAEAENL